MNYTWFLKVICIWHCFSMFKHYHIHARITSQTSIPIIYLDNDTNLHIQIECFLIHNISVNNCSIFFLYHPQVKELKYHSCIWTFYKRAHEKIVLFILFSLPFFPLKQQDKVLFYAHHLVSFPYISWICKQIPQIMNVWAALTFFAASSVCQTGCLLWL